MENYTQHITRTRIAIPRKRADLISRQRLLDALDELLDKKVIIIAAPAGYGKTSLLIDLADDLALPVCWYSLDTLDQNISRFLEYFVAAIQVRFPEFKTNIISVLHSSFQKDVDIDAMVTMLVNDIYDQITEHFIIMLDDYHLVVNDVQVNQFLSRFLQNVEENCHIVFASRALLALPDLPLMVARGLVGGLGFEELAFTTGETRELFFTNHHIVLSDAEAEDLCKQTEGWITGLLLTAQTSITRLQAHEKNLRATGVNINDYFELIYNAQPEHIQQFLLYTSLLEDFDFDAFNHTVAKLFPKLCKQYKACADHIFKANLFVQSVGLDGLSLRYHHLFLDYLQQKVRLEQAETYEKLQEIIAAYYRQTQQWEKAYAIYRKEGQLEKQIALLEEGGLQMMFAGNFNLLYQWLDGIDENIILKNPALCSLMGIILSNRGDLSNSLAYLNEALNHIDSDSNQELVSRTLIRKATTLRLMGDFSTGLATAKEALHLVKNNLSLRLIRAESYRIIGSCYTNIGEPLKSIENLQNALEDYKYSNSKDEIAITSLNISNVYTFLGDYDKAKEFLSTSIDYWERSGNNVWLANALNNYGYVQHLRGEVENAIINLEKALHYSQLTNYSTIEAVAYSSIGDIYTDLGALDEAEDVYNKSLKIVQSTKSKNLENYAYYSLALNSIYKNDLAKAKTYISQAIELLQSYESKYDQYLINYSKALYYYYSEQYIQALEFLNESKNFSIEQNELSYIGRTALYILLSNFLIGSTKEITDSYNFLSNYIVSSEGNFLLLATSLREKPLITKIVKKYPEFNKLSDWLSKINNFANELPNYRKRIRRKSNLVPFAPASLDIIALGNMKVKYNNKWLISSDWQTQSARDLFFLLLSKPNGLTKEEIGLILWPEDSEQELKFHFKNAIYRVRHAIGKEIIVLNGDQYKFNNNTDYHFDVLDFRKEIQYIQNTSNWNDKYSHFKKALSLYNGYYLPEMDADWIYLERNELHQLFLQMLHDMSISAFNIEEFTKAIDIAKIILEYDPCNEDAYRISMRAQAAIGNRNEVDHLYKLCKKHLLEELEAPPSKITQKLHQTLMKM